MRRGRGWEFKGVRWDRGNVQQRPTCTGGKERFTLVKMFTLRRICGFAWRNASRARRLGGAQRRQRVCFGLDTVDTLTDCNSERLICRTFNCAGEMRSFPTAGAIRIAGIVDSDSSPDKCNGDERGRK